MAQQQINGATQIKANSVGSGQVASSVIVAGGTNAFTANQSMGSNRLTNVANGTGANDAVNLSQLQAYVQGLSPKGSVVAATTGSETFTIASGSVTQISGTTVDGVSPAVGDRILIKNAPAATGVGTADSTGAGTDQPANGIYTISSNTTNLTVARDSTSNQPLSGSVQPTGAYVLIDAGTSNKGLGYMVTDPPSPDTAFTYGTTNMQWTKFTNAAGVTTVSVVSANGFAGTVANATTTPAITVSTSVTGVLKGNGTAISAATAGTDYMAPSDFVVNETPSGTINGSNTSFTLANTPLAGTEQIFQDGILLLKGAGLDYTISGATITMINAPATGDNLRASYQK